MSRAGRPKRCKPAAVPADGVVDERDALALVVFVGDASLKCLRPLRPGFRHCFVAVRNAHGWVVCDPMSHRTDLSFVGGLSPTELTQWYRSFGLLVIETRLRPAPLRPAPLRLFTCVEAVKRILGIHAPWTLTPWQLYRLLRTSATSDLPPLTRDHV